MRAGLSGCGVRGAQVLQLVRSHQDCTILALHDVDAAAVATLGNAAAIRSRHTDFQAFLQTGIDFVVLAGPCGDRLAQVTAAAEQGVHCLLHAPMAPSAAMAQAMVKTCERNGVKLGVAVMSQADPVFDDLRRALVDDFIGAIVLVHATSAFDQVLRVPPPTGHWQRDPLRSGRGALRQLGSEALHLIHWLCGRAMLSTTAQSTRGFTAMDEDSSVATFTMRGGGLCTFASSHLTTGNMLTLHGTDGAMIVTGDRISLRGRSELRESMFDYTSPSAEQSWSRAELLPECLTQLPRLELHGRFARWIDDLDDFPCPGDLASADLQVFEAIDSTLLDNHSKPIKQ